MVKILLAFLLGRLKRSLGGSIGHLTSIGQSIIYQLKILGRLETAAIISSIEGPAQEFTMMD